MKIPQSLYKAYRYLPEIIQYAVWLYHRFNLSHRDIEGIDKLMYKPIFVGKLSLLNNE